MKLIIQIPCFNPDGNVITTDWYNEWVGTEYEATGLPVLYHHYIGHDNNRDAFMQNTVESQYGAEIMFREWIPQAYIDHHQMGPFGARMYVPPYAEPIRPDGDPLRRWSASGADLSNGDGALFQYLNASKRSAVLDLDTPAGRDALLNRVADADWLVESEAPGTLEALGLGLDALQARNPRLSRVSVTPWGSTGPWSGRPSTEFTLQAATGSIATLSNIGPGLASVGPSQSFAFFAPWQKLLMVLLMLLGRLEFFALLALLQPQFWRR